MTSVRSEPEISTETGRFPASGEPHLQRGTILLVEDEDFVRLVTKEVLSFAGYEVLCARHAAEAARIFKQHENRIQLLLTDVVLPGRNGHELARDLRRASPNLKMMFISGYPEHDATRPGLRESGTSYLAKPFSSESLTRSVERALAGEVGCNYGSENETPDMHGNR